MPRQQWTVVTAPATPAGEGGAPAAGPTYRHVSAKDGFPTLDGVATLHELFDRARTKFADSPCLGWRPMVGVGEGERGFAPRGEAKRDTRAWPAPPPPPPPPPPIPIR